MGILLLATGVAEFLVTWLLINGGDGFSPVALWAMFGVSGSLVTARALIQLHKIRSQKKG